MSEGIKITFVDPEGTDTVVPGDPSKTLLEIAEEHGVKLGSARPGHWRGRENRRQAGLRKAIQSASAAHKDAADAAYVDLLPLMQEMRSAGKSLQEIADELNRQEYETRRGAAWNRMQVSRVLNRSELKVAPS